MKITVISYSFTGNNESLAKSIATELKAEHLKITEDKTRTIGTIVFDILLNRTPKTNPAVNTIDHKDLIIFVGPVWIGHAATPFRTYFKHLKNNSDQYAFVSINGGSLNSNPNLASELEKKVGRKPVSFINLHIVDLLPSNSTPTTQDTQSYRLTDSDIKKLTEKSVKILQKDIIK